MKILSVDCSAGPASVAIFDEKIIATSFVNVKLTHSQTLLPMLKSTLDSSKLSIDDIDYFAISSGPGSFTGIRIGISAIKGLAAKNNKPCVFVSTLDAMVQIFKNQNCIVCAVMDARCNQVYNAMFEIKNYEITRLTDDRALLCDELFEEIRNNNFSDKIIITGDGSDLFYPYVEKLDNTELSFETQRYQNAIGVGLAAMEKIKNNDVVSPSELLPIYLRLPQAERELKKKQENKENKK